MKKILSTLNASEAHVPRCLTKLASLGDYGSCPGNVKRDLLKALGTPDAPLFEMRQIPCKIQKTTEAETEHEMPIKVPILCPHHVLADLYHNHRSKFDNKMFGGAL